VGASSRTSPEVRHRDHTAKPRLSPFPKTISATSSGRVYVRIPVTRFSQQFLTQRFRFPLGLNESLTDVVWQEGQRDRRETSALAAGRNAGSNCSRRRPAQKDTWNPSTATSGASLSSSVDGWWLRWGNGPRRAVASSTRPTAPGVETDKEVQSHARHRPRNFRRRTPIQRGGWRSWGGNPAVVWHEPLRA